MLIYLQKYTLVNTEELKSKIRERFGDKYNLDKVEFKTYKTPITVTCAEHRRF